MTMTIQDCSVGEDGVDSRTTSSPSALVLVFPARARERKRETDRMFTLFLVLHAFVDKPRSMLSVSNRTDE